MIDFAQISNHRFSAKNKVLELQTTAASNDNGTASETGFGEAFGEWCIVAVPGKRELDASGNVKGACEAIVADMPDQRTVIGTRDVRVSKYAQDLKAGETAFLNFWGTRLFLGEKSVTLNAGGGFLSFDITKRTVALVGIPSSEGGAAPYLSIATGSIGLVSESGQASMTVAGSSVVLSGAAIALDAGRVNLGKGAADPVVTYSMLMQILAQVNAVFVSLTKPAVVPPPPGRRVFAPYGG